MLHVLHVILGLLFAVIEGRRRPIPSWKRLYCLIPRHISPSLGFVACYDIVFAPTPSWFIQCGCGRCLLCLSVFLEGWGQAQYFVMGGHLNISVDGIV